MSLLSQLDPNGSKSSANSNPNWPYFYLISFSARFLQGCSDAFLMTSIFSIVSQLYKEDTALYIGYLESATTIGMCIGAPLGSFLNSYLGY